MTGLTHETSFVKLLNMLSGPREGIFFLVAWLHFSSFFFKLILLIEFGIVDPVGPTVSGSSKRNSINVLLFFIFLLILFFLSLREVAMDLLCSSTGKKFGQNLVRDCLPRKVLAV